MVLVGKNYSIDSNIFITKKDFKKTLNDTLTNNITHNIISIREKVLIKLNLF